jgi:hypothetical protein
MKDILPGIIETLRPSLPVLSGVIVGWLLKMFTENRKLEVQKRGMLLQQATALTQTHFSHYGTRTGREPFELFHGLVHYFEHYEKTGEWVEKFLEPEPIHIN